MGSIDYVFVASPGRSGTAYLASLLEGCIGRDGRAVVVAHEPIPVGCGAAMRNWNDGFEEDMQQIVVYKKEVVERRRRGGIYVETNAQFIKGFGWEWMRSLSDDERRRVALIHLVREEGCAESFLANREAPGHDSFADVWNIRPGCVKGHECLPDMSPRESVRWQLDEIQCRVASFVKEFPGATLHSTTLARLNTVEGVEQLCRSIGVDAKCWSSMQRVIGQAQNTGKERVHSAAKESEATMAVPSEPSERIRLVQQAAEYIISRRTALEIKNKRRAILGMDDCVSCMVGAKAAVVELHDDLQRDVFVGMEIDFTDLRWHLICEVVHRVDPLDAMFRHVTRMCRGTYVLDGLNGSPMTYRAVRPRSISITSPSFIVCISGGGGRIAQHLLLLFSNKFLRDHMYRAQQRLEVRLLVRSNTESQRRAHGKLFDLRDTAELQDPRLTVSIHSEAQEAFRECHLAVLLASAKRLPHYERYHLGASQAAMYREHAKAIADTAHPQCQVVVMANPVVSVASLVANVSPSIASRVTAVTALDAFRARTHLEDVFKRMCGDTGPDGRVKVEQLQVLGNHSKSVWIDPSGASVVLEDGRRASAREVFGVGYLHHELQSFVRTRGREIINLSGATSIASATAALYHHILFVLGICGVGKRFIDSVGVCIRTEAALKWSGVERGKFPSQEYTCLSLPCWYDGARGIVTVSERAVIRALHWTPLARESLQSSMQELALEAEAITGALVPSPQQRKPLPLGSVMEMRLSLAAARLREADCIIVYAGAGMSVSSGIPDITDFEAAFPAVVERGISSIFHASSHAHFIDAPDSAWGFWGARARSYAAASPDRSYAQLLTLCERAPSGYFVITSNIDRFFARASFREDRILEIHGSLFDVQCTDVTCTRPVQRMSPAYFDEEHLPIDLSQWLTTHERVPKCETCGCPLRIATELAIDGHYNKALVQEQKRRYKDFMRGIPAAANVVLLELGCGVVMSKLRDQATRFNRVRSLICRHNRSVGLTTHVRVNTTHWSIDATNGISLPLSADAAIGHFVEASTE